MSPNPADFTTSVELNISESAAVAISMIDANGKRVLFQDYGITEGYQRLRVDTNAMENGLYMVQIQIGNKVLSKKLLVLH